MFSYALSGITDAQTWIASREVGFGKLGSILHGPKWRGQCLSDSPCGSLSPQPENEAVQAVMLLSVRLTPPLWTVKKDCSLSRTLQHSGSIQACIWEDSWCLQLWNSYHRSVSSLQQRLVSWELSNMSCTQLHVNHFHKRNEEKLFQIIKYHLPACEGLKDTWYHSQFVCGFVSVCLLQNPCGSRLPLWMQLTWEQS